jgi:hypothetical protein
MTAKKSFHAQIAVSASLLAISSCILLHQKISSLRKCHCYLQHKKEKRKKNSSSSNSALSLCQIRKKDRMLMLLIAASKQATPEAPHSWFLTSKIVKNLGEELDETDR